MKRGVSLLAGKTVYQLYFRYLGHAEMDFDMGFLVVILSKIAFVEVT